MLGLAGLVGGCSRAIPVDIDATREPTAKLEAMQRFAVAHTPAQPQRGIALSRRVADAFVSFLDDHGFLAQPRQEPLTTAADRNDLLREVAAYSRRAFQERGYRLDPADPQFILSLDYAYGPVEFLIPAAVQLGKAGPAEAGRPATGWAHAVAVYVYDVRDPHREVWVGSAISINDIPDPRVMRYLLEEIAERYPRPTDGPLRRTVKLD